MCVHVIEAFYMEYMAAGEPYRCFWFFEFHGANTEGEAITFIVDTLSSSPLLLEVSFQCGGHRMHAV